MANNIRNNTISKINAIKDLNKLDKIKNEGTIRYKKCTPRQKELLNLFDNLFNIILTDKTLESESQENEGKNKNVESKNKKMKIKIMKIKMKQ